MCCCEIDSIVINNRYVNSFGWFIYVQMSLEEEMPTESIE